MTTRKEIIINSYMEFQKNVKSIINIDLFPKLEDVDVIDLLIYFDLYFKNTDDYSDIINELLFMNNIKLSNEKLNEIIPILTKYINQFKNIQKVL